jgi:type IV secretory pathway TrbD component
MSDKRGDLVRVGLAILAGTIVSAVVDANIWMNGLIVWTVAIAVLGCMAFVHDRLERRRAKPRTRQT